MGDMQFGHTDYSLLGQKDPSKLDHFDIHDLEHATPDQLRIAIESARESNNVAMLGGLSVAGFMIAQSRRLEASRLLDRPDPIFASKTKKAQRQDAIKSLYSEARSFTEIGAEALPASTLDKTE